jgi:hypothetical protein
MLLIHSFRTNARKVRAKALPDRNTCPSRHSASSSQSPAEFERSVSNPGPPASLHESIDQQLRSQWQRLQRPGLCLSDRAVTNASTPQSLQVTTHQFQHSGRPAYAVLHRGPTCTAYIIGRVIGRSTIGSSAISPSISQSRK